jgi:uncharacterized membrane protein YjjP (DUF1212 family)
MVAIVIVFFNPLAGLILGHIALVQIRRTGEAGRTAALVAVAIGWVVSSLLILGALAALAAGSLLSGLGSSLLA